MLQRIVRPGKQVTQIVGKYLFGIHIGTLAKSFHIPPDIGSIQRLAGLGGKHRASSLFLFLDILPKQLAEFRLQEDGSPLAFVTYLCAAALHRFHRDEAQLGNTNIVNLCRRQFLNAQKSFSK